MGDKSYIQNPHLSGMTVDELYHIGLNTNDDLKTIFSDVKFVCLGGSSGRMEKFAKLLQDRLREEGLNCGSEIKNLSKTDRYVMYKAGPVLSVNHGMGIPSISIILNELIKLLHYANARDVVFFRLGTSGGLGTEPGTVVVTKNAVNELLKPQYEQIILGKRVSHSSELDSKLTAELLACNREDFAVVSGDTMCTLDFYEGQARLNGAFCDYESEDKMSYLQKVYEAGVRNIEMESLCFAAMCRRAGIPAAVVCVALLNRLRGDQLNHSPEDRRDYENRPMKLIISYIIQQLTKNGQK
ncbi:uridine phosphorylase 1-like [Dendronephthya gigantea]|uniref:uridine phosphorylase 1-like n=1 Tax=Dendronephthya gigantea TaxID=151771 RepID=UPI00106C05C4|nr:uridine phosphorylase 1-like [Dendronephthya gigantea]